MKKLRIGITIGLHHEAETLWNNGIKQNAVFLAEALKNCPNVESVVLVNTTHVAITDRLPWDLKRWPTVTFNDAKDNVDVLIELGGQIDPAATDYLKRRGARLVSYCCGFEYVHAMESVIFGKPSFGENLFVNQRYDDIWMIPQVANISQAYFEVLRRQSAQVVPFIWSPIFLNERTAKVPNSGEYRPRTGPRRLSVMEPNINVVKFCLYPTMIGELAYREQPDRIELLQVTNAQHLAVNCKEFISLMNQLDIVRQSKAVFLGRFETPTFLAERTDIVISHQWENPLNYLYLEVCWQGYPLVHNATLCTDIGYYYHANNVQEGAKQVIKAIEVHDAQYMAYRDAQRSAINRFMPENEALSKTYTQLLDSLMERPAR
ncbi:MULTISPECIES: DUF2827 domain-containing protein [unclassified Caballeronia]|uniref:DUF2827 domain-containing protein n=1 Tax=unclassified Caballeronia TaxID=2646786 RepID=UPI00285B9DFC|nr:MULTISPECIES: DUF2827 domain-containing protein [unclassified Caballeronia]MDR5772497.1 DUF2827 domain-containing protein [Caballeronia sp. LZ002]MDR5847931.1 DUF2827 domain-containing protein [Caballeronia sp. LZ003]